MAWHFQASIDALVANSSSRALLVFSHSSAASAGGVMLPDLVVTAMGEMVLGFPLQILPPCQHLPEMKYPPAEGVPVACEVEA